MKEIVESERARRGIEDGSKQREEPDRERLYSIRASTKLGTRTIRCPRDRGRKVRFEGTYPWTRSLATWSPLVGLRAEKARTDGRVYYGKTVPTYLKQFYKGGGIVGFIALLLSVFLFDVIFFLEKKERTGKGQEKTRKSISLLELLIAAWCRKIKWIL